MDRSGIFPFDLEEWRRIIVRFDLHSGADFPEWLSIIRELTLRLIDCPAQMAQFSYSDALTFSLLLEKDSAIIRLWQACCVAYGTKDKPLYRIPYETNSNLLAQSIRAPSLEETGVARPHKKARLALDLPEKYDNAGPSARIRMIADSDAPTDAVQKFLETGTAINILRQAETTMGSIASGIQ